MPAETNSKPNEEMLLAIINNYPGENRYILSIMQDMQKQFNYLPRQGLEMIALHVDSPFSQVYSMATFYKAFSLVPKGRINFKVCDGTACHIKGSNVIIDQIYKHLGIRPGETTPDGEFSLETVNCIGACALAPAVLANDRVHPKVTSAGIVEIIKSYGGHVDASSK
ncbi:MAG: NAD(P)H-dependent oxidoreductase subunit E [Syntrophomonadaceae bacterium]|jgi:NADH:ubiquinone oxidoreductase subunit E|nr:NAD(P)H-dependent oxidoreductase subunit E [Syntrophomonadaceae bacterium]